MTNKLRSILGGTACLSMMVGAGIAFSPFYYNREAFFMKPEGKLAEHRKLIDKQDYFVRANYSIDNIKNGAGYSETNSAFYTTVTNLERLCTQELDKTGKELAAMTFDSAYIAEKEKNDKENKKLLTKLNMGFGLMILGLLLGITTEIKTKK